MSLARIVQALGGERAGKSRFCAADLTIDLMGWATPDEPRLYWLVGDVYEATDQEFAYVSDALHKMNLVTNSSIPRSAGRPKRLEGPGYTLKTKSASEIMRIGMEAPHYIIMCEAAQMSKAVFLRLRGRIAETRGRLVLGGTLEGSRDWYSDLHHELKIPGNVYQGETFSIPTWANTIIFPGGWDDPEIQALRASMPETLFMERYGAVPCPPHTLVFPTFSQDVHVRDLWVDVDWDKGIGPIEVAIDPGYDHPYAVLAVQRLGRYVRVYDEVYETRLKGNEMIELCKKRPWWPYVQGGTIDVAGKAHHAGKSQVEVWRQHAGITLRSQFVPILDGITRYATFMGGGKFEAEARVFFDTRCAKAIREHGKYKYKDLREDRPKTELPIDRYNDAIKALTYWLVDQFGYAPRLHKSESHLQPRYPRRAKVYA